VRLAGDEMAADADDGDAGHFSGTYMEEPLLRPPTGEFPGEPALH
jgi:hypothetical protein